MPIDPHILAFTSIVVLLTITPGADTMLTIRSVLAGGRRAGICTTLGISSGLFFHAAISALGLSVILVQSAMAFTVVKWVGAGYLIVLGVQSLLHALRGAPAPAAEEEPPARPRSLRSAYLTGLLTNVCNPKVAIFYLAFLPQFLDLARPMLPQALLLGGIHAALNTAWLSLIVVLFGQFRALLRRPAVQRRLEAITSVVLIGFGLRLAVE